MLRPVVGTPHVVQSRCAGIVTPVSVWCARLHVGAVTHGAANRWAGTDETPQPRREGASGERLAVVGNSARERMVHHRIVRCQAFGMMSIGCMVGASGGLRLSQAGQHIKHWDVAGPLLDVCVESSLDLIDNFVVDVQRQVRAELTVE